MIRLFELGDAERLPAIFSASISQLATSDYSPEQTEAWLARAPSPDKFRAMAENGNCLYIACAHDGEPAGFALIEPDGHLDLLYVSPQHARRGHGSALIAQCETTARTAGCGRIYAEASETALPAFRRAGFAVDRRRDFTIGEVAIHNYAVSKALRVR